MLFSFLHSVRANVLCHSLRTQGHKNYTGLYTCFGLTVVGNWGGNAGHTVQISCVSTIHPITQADILLSFYKGHPHWDAISLILDSGQYILAV